MELRLRVSPAWTAPAAASTLFSSPSHDPLLRPVVDRPVEIRISKTLAGKDQRAGDGVRNVIAATANMINDVFAAHPRLALERRQLAAENLIVKQGAGARIDHRQQFAVQFTFAFLGRLQCDPAFTIRFDDPLATESITANCVDSVAA